MSDTAHCQTIMHGTDLPGFYQLWHSALHRVNLSKQNFQISHTRLCIVLRDTARAFELSVAEMSYDKRYSNCSRGITNLGLPTWLPSSVGTWGADLKIQLLPFDYKETQHVTSSRRICSDMPILTVCVIRNKFRESCSNRCIKKSIVSSLTSGDCNAISR